MSSIITAIVLMNCFDCAATAGHEGGIDSDTPLSVTDLPS